MSVELLAMLGGSVSGFLMKFLATQAQNQARLFEQTIKKQEVADASADAAAKRGGTSGNWIRRFIVVCTMFAIIAAPFIISFTDIGVSVQKDTSFLFGLISGKKWELVTGYAILPEVRQTALAIVGFYFGASQVK
tara:strand:+ start:1406 stop:1810 length:405 start_codon:yes stop_codon:yes gene_type:complete